MKWNGKWDGHRSSQWSSLGGFRTLDVVNKGPGAWWWSACSDATENACGQAETEEQAKACAVAVATALGWVKAEPKPERVLVEEWLEEPDSGVVCSECREPHRLAMSERAKLSGRIVHVRRYKR